MRNWALAVSVLVLGAESGAAQDLPDAADLVSTVGTVLADSMVPTIGRRNRLEVLPPASGSTPPSPRGCGLCRRRLCRSAPAIAAGSARAA